jgi:2-oxo-4-hydroxy-4-carboxy--5-ureidoimidazoline (OHCU) decarboxylase
MSIKNFLFKKMLQSKLKGVPEAEQEKFLAMIEKNPDFFQKIAEEAQIKIKSGKDQTSAIMETISEHKDEFQKVFGDMKK